MRPQERRQKRKGQKFADFIRQVLTKRYIVRRRHRLRWLIDCVNLGKFIPKETVAVRRQVFNDICYSVCPLGGLCFACDERPAEHRHHIIPLCRGGWNSEENLVALCRMCHGVITKRQILPPRCDVYVKKGFEKSQIADIAAGRKRYSGTKAGSLSGFSGIVANVVRESAKEMIDFQESLARN